MSREIMQQALTVLKAWDSLIKYQYSGTSEAMTAMQNVAWRTLDTIEGLEQELANLTPTIEDASQDWANLDGAVAWHLIERHAENWGDVGKMMDEYVAAKLAKPDKFIDICIDRKYVIRNYKSIITDIGIFCEFTLDEWNEHAKNIRELCEPEQEPVAWMEDSIELYVSDHPTHTHTIPLYTAPPRKEWVGLTQDEIEEIYRGTTRDNGMCSGLSIALEVQLKLKEKNNAV